MTAVLERAAYWPCFLVSFAVLALAHGNAIHDPPYWDSLTGAFTQAHWQATHSFSPLALLAGSPSFNDGGACVYPFSVYPVLVGAFERCGASIAVTHTILHVLSFAAGAAVLAALFQLARPAVGGALAALVTVVCATLPLFRALVAQMNMDVLVAAFTLLALLSLGRGRHRRAVMWAAFALLLKPTGIIVVVALAVMLALRRVRPAWFGTTVEERPRIASALWMLGGLFLLFAVELALAGQHGKLPPGVSLFGGALPFLGKRLWTMPEFGLTLLALLFVAPLVAKRARRGAAQPLAIDGVVFAIVFVGFYCQYQNVLPRYFLQAFPIVLAALVAAVSAHFSRKAVGTALALFALFGVVNGHGRFHPTKFADWTVPLDVRPLYANDGWLLERSLAYRDDLELNRALAAAVEARRDQVVVAGWPLLQLLAEPRFGYVTTPPRLVAAETALTWTAQPIASASTVADRTRFVRLVSPNVYAGPDSRVRDGDEVIETFERGRSRAFLLRRPSDSDDSDR